MRLADFIVDNIEPILQAWEDFAKTIGPAEGFDEAELRDHAEQMLRAIAADLQTPQTPAEQIEKSRGKAQACDDETAAESHAIARYRAGFTIDQMVSEYRALRASVLMQWLPRVNRDVAFEAEDMTRFNEAIDQALAESIASYAQAVKATQSIFLGILGHDLRTPLGAILLGAEVLLRADDLGAKPTKIASRIYTSVKRASGIVSDLLDFTRSQLGNGIPVQLAETNLAVVCENIVEEVRTFHPDCHIVFETGGDLAGAFDAARMEQVFANLIGNAVQHGSPSTPIMVRLQADHGCAVFTVHNQGQPIAQEAIPHIFDPLARSPEEWASQHASTVGLGLGLYIASEIVAAHQGRIGVTSETEHGTVFTVTVPLGSVSSQKERR